MVRNDNNNIVYVYIKLFVLYLLNNYKIIIERTFWVRYFSRSWEEVGKIFMFKRLKYNGKVWGFLRVIIKGSEYVRYDWKCKFLIGKW